MAGVLVIFFVAILLAARVAGGINSSFAALRAAEVGLLGRNPQLIEISHATFALVLALILR